MTSEATSTMVGPYRVDGLIGRGGMGEVHRAYDTRRQRTVALKLLPSALSGDEEYRERFRRESLVAAALTSPHVVPIHDFGDIDGRLFIDMRLIDGTDLAHQIAGRPMAPQRAVAIVTQVCDALADAHAQGIVHRDVKPSNILLTGSDFAYLVDFGIAASDSTGPGLTATGNTIGTFGYMAPERFDGRTADPRSDIYSLGCVLHELLTGCRPFAEHTSTPSLIRAHLMDEPVAPSATAASVPAALDHAVLRALAKEPQQRHHSVTELADDLRAGIAIPSQRGATRSLTSFAATSSPTGRAQPPAAATSPSTFPPQNASTPRHTLRRAVMAGAIAAVLGLGVGGGLLLATDTSGSATSVPQSTTPRLPSLPGLIGTQKTAKPVSFGETQEPRAGVTVIASEPQPYQPSSSAAVGERAERMSRVEVTLTNNTDRYINFGDQFMTQLQIDGARTMPVFDIASNVGGGPRLEAVAPGASTTFSVAWALPQRSVPVTLELAPLSFRGDGGQPVAWTGDA